MNATTSSVSFFIQKSQGSKFTRPLLFIFFLGLYTSFGISVGDKIFSGAICFFTSVIYLVLARPKLSPPMMIGLGTVFMVALTSIFFSPDFDGFWDEHLKSLIVLTTTLVTVIALSSMLESVGRDWLYPFAKYGVIILLFFAFLETRTPLRRISDEFRQLTYPNQFIYSSEGLDVDRYGSVRPNLFTQEPSHLAKFVSALILVWFFLSRAKQRYLYLLLICGIAYGVIYSLTLIPALFVGSAVVAYELLRRDFVKGSIRILGLASLVGGAASLVLNFGEFYYLPLSSRLEAAVHHEDASVVIRLIAPVSLAANVIGEYPVFGSGVGGKEIVHDNMIENFLKYPVIRMERFEYGTSVGWANAFFEIPIFFGIVGTLMIVLGLAYYFKAEPYGGLLLAVLVFCTYFNGDSGFVSFRPWCYFTLVWGAIRIANKMNSADGSAMERKEQFNAYPAWSEDGQKKLLPTMTTVTDAVLKRQENSPG